MAEPSTPTTPSGHAANDGGTENKKPTYTSSDRNAEQEKIKSIQSELSTNNKLNSLHDIEKGKPIDVTIQLKSYDDKNRIEYISVIEELPPEIEFISADPEAKYDKTSHKIKWDLSGLYVSKKDLAFSVYGREGGSFQIPTTINAHMILQDGRRISGYKDVDPISIITYNNAPEIIQNRYPESIIFPVFSDRSVHVSIRDIDNDSVKCNLYDNNLEIISPINAGTNKDLTWNLPFFWWGTYSYTIKADDGEKKEFTKQRDYPGERIFNVVYGLSNLVYLLALCSIGPLILAFVSFKGYRLNKKEKKGSILKMEMDLVIEPLYLIFKENNNIVNYMSLSISDKINHKDNCNLKSIEPRIINILEKKESHIDPRLLDLYNEYKKCCSEKDFAKANLNSSLMFDHISNRYKYLKHELYGK
ncbi:MAG: hypothetical protein NTX42_13045 [Methanothrix sp.]|nr:hypothetical protein [Methanothrix sp.]